MIIDNINIIKRNYHFTETDVNNIESLSERLTTLGDKFAADVYEYTLKLPNIKKYIKESSEEKFKQIMKIWYLSLFSGKYNDEYFYSITKMSERHVKIGLPTHYVNVTINFTRRFINRHIDMYLDYQDSSKMELIASCGKILDINLDILTSAYRQEELEAAGVMSKAKNYLIKFSTKTGDMIDFVLVFALIIVSFFVIALFFYDIYLLVATDISFEVGILTVLGSLLILWAVSELMSEEIKHLKGEGFAMMAFLSLAMAAMIRKILITSLAGDKILSMLGYGMIVLSLGIVYWLINKGNKKF